ncbi:hypothetical protein BJ742DRAFT_736608 [Cladochytrium replicatum]|nr:hypothetical protein BJ742DRAFT_736608 [Cladochytrium replicatum]
MSGPEVSPDLMKLAEGFNAKVQAGSAIQASSGFGGKGLEKLDAQSNMVKKIQKKSTGGELGEEGEGEQDEATAAATAAAEAKFEGTGTDGAASFSDGIEINDYPEKARWKVTNKEQIVIVGDIQMVIDTGKNEIKRMKRLSQAWKWRLLVGEFQILRDG